MTNSGTYVTLLALTELYSESFFGCNDLSVLPSVIKLNHLESSRFPQSSGLSKKQSMSGYLRVYEYYPPISDTSDKLKGLMSIGVGGGFQYLYTILSLIKYRFKQFDNKNSNLGNEFQVQLILTICCFCSHAAAASSSGLRKRNDTRFENVFPLPTALFMKP